MKKEPKKTLPIVWILIGVAITVVLFYYVPVFISNVRDIGKSTHLQFLENNDYVVTQFFCSDWDNNGYLYMETYGSREDQVSSGRIALIGECPNASQYNIVITEPTKECWYMIDGELYKAYADKVFSFKDFDINETKLKESLDFIVWKTVSQKAYLNTSIDVWSEEWDRSYAYGLYLEDGLSSSVLFDIIDYTYQSDHERCKNK